MQNAASHMRSHACATRSRRADARRNPRHPGAKKLTRARDLYRHDELTRSELEAILRSRCDEHALPHPLVNHTVEDKEVDFFWPDQRLIVETDGRATHFTLAAYERDRARDAHLLTFGYRTMRVTDRQVRRDAATVARRLSALLTPCDRDRDQRAARSASRTFSGLPIRSTEPS